MKVVLLVPDGVGVRNFVLGPFLRQFERGGNCSVLHNIPAQLLADYRTAVAPNVEWLPLNSYRETSQAALLRYTINYAHLYWGDTQGMRYVRDRPMSGSTRNRAKHLTAKTVGRLFAAPAGIRLLDRQHCATVSHRPEVEQYRRLFAQQQPDVLFCSHQRPPEIIPAVLAARELGIPTATFIFSWDNLTSKGRIAAPFDHFLVWSDLMRQELLRFYPDIVPARVHVVGTPQFDPYADQSLLWSRTEFCRRIGADPTRPLLCYSGGDPATAPEDQDHLRVLLELIRSGAIKGQPQVLLRPTPVDDGVRYEAVRRAYPELLFAQPAWVHTNPEEWSGSIPQAADVQFLVNLTQHADLNINVASTMTLDFAIHDRPVVNIAFDLDNPVGKHIALWDYYYRFEHYRPVVELGAARFARSPAQLAEHINAYLADPLLDQAARRRFVELEVGAPLGESSRRIYQCLQSLANSASPSASSTRHAVPVAAL